MHNPLAGLKTWQISLSPWLAVGARPQTKLFHHLLCAWVGPGGHPLQWIVLDLLKGEACLLQQWVVWGNQQLHGYFAERDHAELCMAGGGVWQWAKPGIDDVVQHELEGMLNPENLAGSCDPAGRGGRAQNAAIPAIGLQAQRCFALKPGALVHFSFQLEQLAISINQPGSTLLEEAHAKGLRALLEIAADRCLMLMEELPNLLA